VASSDTSIEPSASRQRMLRHQGTCMLLLIQGSSVIFRCAQDDRWRFRQRLCTTLRTFFQSFCAYFKFIADTPDGFDITIDRIGLYFLAQGADVYVNDMTISIIIIAPDFIHEHFTGVYSIGRPGEQGQYIEFGGGQHYLNVVDLDATRQQIN